MISAYIFAGPTLPHFKIEEKFGYKLSDSSDLTLNSGEKIRFLPPVAEGDVLKLVPLKPKIIGIVDGYFENVPSVWHKEILYAMSQGIHVMGAASMGALRAAELQAFGMEGVGASFKGFLDGFLEDDDEVTVAHGPEELGFPQLSEAMVNIRRTFDDACRQNILSASNRELLLSIAKRLHYKQRNYGKIITQAKELGLELCALQKFQSWLQENRQDQKLLDALDLIKKIVKMISGPAEIKKVVYNFENTAIWNRSRSVSIESPHAMRKSTDQSILGFLSHEDKQRLMALGKPLEFKEGRNLFFRGDKGDNFYIIISGGVTIGISTNEGREIILNKLPAGDIFGEIGMFDQAERTTDAYALAGTKLISIDRESFLGFLDKNPALYREIVAFLCRRLRHFSGHVENLVLSNSFERLVAKLVLVARASGHGKSAVIETSQSDLAKMLGLSREVVNKNLQELRARNLLELKRKKIYISDIEKLEQLQKNKAG